MEQNCIFCKIVRGEIPAYKIWEDEEFIAFLDIYPNIRGQSVVIPKRHIQSNAYAIAEEDLIKLIKATRVVAKLLEKQLLVRRVHLVLEGMGVNHLHAKLYPAIGLDEKEFGEPIGEEGRFFEFYPGHTTTLLGPRAKDSELASLQKLITG